MRGGTSSTVAERFASISTWQLLRFAGIAALIATGAIHLDLYLTGYRTIPTIGWLFLLQIISVFVLAVVTTVWGRRLICLAGAGLLLSTLVGYLFALRVSLFGFREVRTTAGIVAGIIEVIGFASLAAFALRPDRRSLFRSSRTPARHRIVSQRVALPTGRWVIGILTVLAAVSLGLLLPNAGATPTSTSRANVTIKAGEVHGTSVLTNAHGYTLYWFAPDSATASHCYATCAAYWPPVLGTASPSAGVAGSFATLKRSNGSNQVTYNGHPLYTYVGDSAPGQASGNRIRLNGGWWYEMKVSS
jgi:predicted lipoprotein with Yx(FWY)xxD motif